MRGALVYDRIGKVAPLYDVSLRLSGYERSVGAFVRAVPHATSLPLRILDCGCGTGPYTMALLTRFPRATVTAFDRNPDMVKRLRAKVRRRGWQHRVELFTADATGSLEEVTGLYDLVIVSGVLEHVPLEATAANISRFVRSGGYFLHSPVRYSPYGVLVGMLYRFRPYPRDRTLQAFTKLGFTLERIVTLSRTQPASYKELHILRKL